MGETIELTSVPGSDNVFYEITSNGITFGVRSAENAILGLAKRPAANVDVIVELDNNSKIKFRDGSVVRVPTFDILQNDVYNYFWLCWDSHGIKLGKLGDLRPLILHNRGIEGIKHVTFGYPDANSITYWKIDLPPVVKPKELKPVEGGKMQWLPCNGQLPDGVLIGGFENNEPLYVIRAHHRGSLTPGKFVPSLGNAVISWDGTAHEKSQFEALCGFDCTWVKTSGAQIPPNAVVGGYSEIDHENLYICRVNINGNIIPGKVHPAYREAFVAHEGREKGFTNYEILVVPSGDNRVIERKRLNQYHDCGQQQTESSESE